MGLGWVSSPASAQLGSYTVFNNPASGDSQERHAITNHLVELIDGTPTGAWIRIGAFSFTNSSIRKALIRAICRGVVVRVVIDEFGQDNHDDSCGWPDDGSYPKGTCNNYENLFGLGSVPGLAWHLLPYSTLPAAYCEDMGEPTDGSSIQCPNCELTICGTGDPDLARLGGVDVAKVPGQACISNHPSSIQHEKYLTFSTTYNAQGTRLSRVVVVMSANLTSIAGYDQWNNAVVMYGDTEWYDAWKSHFNEQRSEIKRDDYYTPSASPPSGYFQSPLTYFTAFFSPNKVGDGDIVADRLVQDRIPGDAGANDSGCLLWVNQSIINSSRALVTDEFKRIRDQGCDVRILYDQFEGAAGDEWFGIPIQQAGTLVSGELVDHTHHKYIVYRGRYDGVSNKKRVWTGSHNLTGAALVENDEVLLKLGTTAMFNDFRDNFCQMWNRYDTDNSHPIPSGLCD